MRLTQMRGERLLIPPLLDRDKAERAGDLGVVAVVEAAIVAARGGLDLLEQRYEVVSPLGVGSEACDDDDHCSASISPAYARMRGVLRAILWRQAGCVYGSVLASPGA